MERVSPLAMDWRKAKSDFRSRTLMQNLFYYGMHGTVVGTAMFGTAMFAFGDGDLARSSIDHAMSGESAAALEEMLRYTAGGLDELSRATHDFFDTAKEIARTNWAEFAQDPLHPFKVMGSFFTSLPGGDQLQEGADWLGARVGEAVGAKGSLLEKYSAEAISFVATAVVPMAITWMGVKKGFKALSACANAAASAIAK